MQKAPRPGVYGVRNKNAVCMLLSLLRLTTAWGHSLSPGKEARGTAVDLLTAALMVITGAGKRGSSGPSSLGVALCTSHFHYLGLFYFIAEQLLCVGNKAVTAELYRPGVGESYTCSNRAAWGKVAQAGG